MRRINVGHQRKKIVKKHPVDPQPLEHGVIAPRELNDGQALFSVSHHLIVHPNTSLIASGARLEQLEATLGVLHPIGHGH